MFRRPERREALFGGEGSVLVEALEGGLCEPFSAVLLCELAPGGRVGEHLQQADAELILGLAGEAVLYVQERPHPVTPGRVVALPLGSRLAIDNASTEHPFRYLIVKARPR
jgi:uncharacterized cupin superfamily protein